MAGKKDWEKPQLVILGRARPEESVLKHCKQKTQGHGPHGDSCFKVFKMGACSGLGKS